MVLVRKVLMSKSGFEDEVLIKLIVNNNSYCYKKAIQYI
jgi:hypothetical protein